MLFISYLAKENIACTRWMGTSPLTYLVCQAHWCFL